MVEIIDNNLDLKSRGSGVPFPPRNFHKESLHDSLFLYNNYMTNGQDLKTYDKSSFNTHEQVSLNSGMTHKGLSSKTYERSSYVTSLGIVLTNSIENTLKDMTRINKNKSPIGEQSVS
jgi:hypothetical protein